MTWFSGGLGRPGVRVGLDDLEDLDSMILPEVTRHSLGIFFFNKQNIFKGMHVAPEGLNSIECAALYLMGKSCGKIQAILNMNQNCIILELPKVENTCLCILGKSSAPLARSTAEINIGCG